MQFLIAVLAVLASAGKIPRQFENPSLRRWLQDITPYGEVNPAGVIETNVDNGCPANNVRPTFNFRFRQNGTDSVVVINKNLGNRYCSEAAGLADSTYCKTDTPAEILYCNVGVTGESNPEEICLRVTDVSADDPNASPYECDSESNYYKCGNVLTPGTDFGQIQIQMEAYDRDVARVRLRFETLTCPLGRDREKGRPSDDCVPLTWLGMTMVFLDIDGNKYAQEELTLHDVFNYQMNDTVDAQDRYDASFNPCVYRNAHDGSEDVPFDRECFPEMEIEVEDPAGVYQYRFDPDSQNRIPNAVVGDVVIRNNDLFDTLGSNINGNYPNPTLVDVLSQEQLKRAVVGFWVSDAVQDYVEQGVQCSQDPSCTEDQLVFNDNLPERSYFEVSMGTQKRTIEFAGFSQAISGALCFECGDDGGFPGKATGCDSGDQFYKNRVCRYSDVNNPGFDLAQCTKEHCCEPPPTSHGDPIIWTFDNECYDLNKDGLYVATSHPAFDHEVNIAVYNDYMREIQVVDKSGEVMLSINNLGEVINNDYPHAFSHEVKDCPEDLKDCLETYNEFTFDAQDFRYVVQTLQHDYMDAALKEGEWGPHLDIYPQPYDRFIEHKRDYAGLYIENPLPEELNYCPGGSPRKN